MEDFWDTVFFFGGRSGTYNLTFKYFQLNKVADGDIKRGGREETENDGHKKRD